MYNNTLSLVINVYLTRFFSFSPLILKKTHLYLGKKNEKKPMCIWGTNNEKTHLYMGKKITKKTHSYMKKKHLKWEKTTTEFKWNVSRSLS